MEQVYLLDFVLDAYHRLEVKELLGRCYALKQQARLLQLLLSLQDEGDLILLRKSSLTIVGVVVDQEVGQLLN